MTGIYKAPSYAKTPPIRIANEVAHPGALGSARAQIIIVCPTAAQIATYNSTHVAQNVLVPDTNKILPYTTWLLYWMAGPPADTDYQCAVNLNGLGTAASVANATVTAVKDWVAARRQKHPDVASLDAAIYTTSNSVLLSLPWGILGNPSAVYQGDAAGSIVAGNKGVDNPLRCGRVGPRRSVVPFTGNTLVDYYGDVPPA